jgi:hypothetical protein
MAEIVEFKYYMDSYHIPVKAKSKYLSGDFSGRYVRESDYEEVKNSRDGWRSASVDASEAFITMMEAADFQRTRANKCEADHAALLERHRRLVKVCKRVDAYVPGGGGHSLQAAGALYDLHVALKEEVVA